MSPFQSTVHSPDRDIHQLKDFSFHILEHSLQHSCPCILYQCRSVMNYAPKKTVNYLTNQTQTQTIQVRRSYMIDCPPLDPKQFNPLGPKSAHDQHQFSSNKINTSSREKVVGIHKMITKGKYFDLLSNSTK